MTNGLYGYYDIENKYVVYIGKDAHIDIDKRHKAHTSIREHDTQIINTIIQNNPERYIYFRFIEGNYNRQTLKELEQEAIRIFKTYKYDYPERSVFNFTRGGDGGYAEGQRHPNWRQDSYKVIKRRIEKGKQQYSILGRYGKTITSSINKGKLEELTNKLNNKEITEKEVKKGFAKYNMWDVSHCGYKKNNMFQKNGGDKPRRCFGYIYKGKIVPIGMFNEFVSCQVIDSIVQEEVKKCKHEN